MHVSFRIGDLDKPPPYHVFERQDGVGGVMHAGILLLYNIVADHLFAVES